MRNNFMCAGLAIVSALVGCGGASQSDVSSSRGGSTNSSGAPSFGTSKSDRGGAIPGGNSGAGNSSGGFPAAGAVGGAGYIGGNPAAGGSASAGVAPAIGGSSSPPTDLPGAGTKTANGGSSSTNYPAVAGATISSGGLAGVAGSTGGNDTLANGGASASMGTTLAGGGASIGGTPVSGGAANSVCTDTAQLRATITGGYYNALEVPVVGGGKSYIVDPEWGEKYRSQSLLIDGIGFTISDPEHTASDPSSTEPTGFPAIFIGQLLNQMSLNSNLPKQLSTLTTIPTFMSTNALSKDTSNFNAKYSMMITTSGDVLDSATAISNVRAYVDIWLYKPSERQPWGALEYPGHSVAGASGTWDVWINPKLPMSITYISTTPLEAFSGDLNWFLKDAVKNGYGPLSRYYLNVISAGFEVWSGGDGVQLKQYCAQVN